MVLGGRGGFEVDAWDFYGGIFILWQGGLFITLNICCKFDPCQLQVEGVLFTAYRFFRWGQDFIFLMCTCLP